LQEFSGKQKWTGEEKFYKIEENDVSGKGEGAERIPDVNSPR
jgi:hypothetical protein